MSIRNFRELLAELILLAVLVGFIPDLILGGVVDIYGPCGFSGEICSAIEIQGAMKLLGAWICVSVAVVIGFLISKDFRG